MKKLLAALLLVSLTLIGGPVHAKWEKIPVQVKRPATYELKGIQQVAIVPRDGRSGKYDVHVAEALAERLGRATGGPISLIDRATTSKVLAEQKFAVSGLVPDESVGSLGKLLLAQALILATADNTTKITDVKDTEPVTKYRAKDGAKYEAACPAVTRQAHLSAVMKVVEVETGVTLVDEQREYDDEVRNFRDPNPKDSYIPPETHELMKSVYPNPFDRSQDLVDGNIMIRQLAERAADDFAKLLVPYVETVTIQWDTIIDEPSIYNMVKSGLVTDAREALEAKVPSLEQDKRFVKDPHRMAALYYNCGALHELELDYDGALTWYKKALAADKKTDKVLVDSIKRVRQLMADLARLQNQGTN